MATRERHKDELRLALLEYESRIVAPKLNIKFLDILKYHSIYLVSNCLNTKNKTERINDAICKITLRNFKFH